MNAHERKVLITTCFGHFLSHFNMLVFPAVLIPLSSRLEMSMTDTLQLSFWMYLLFGITAFPWGLVADRWGIQSLFKLFYLGAGICGLIAAWQIDHPTFLMLALAGIGLFSGIYHPIGLGWISKDVRQVSLGMGYNGMFGNLGLACAPLMAGLINWLWGPAQVYIFLGLLNLTGFMLIQRVKKSQPASTESRPDTPGRKDMIGAFLILLVAMMLGGIVYRGVSVIIPSYFELKNAELFNDLTRVFQSFLSENLLATTITSIIFFIGMLGQYSGGKLASRFNLQICYMIFHLITIPMAFLMAYVANLSLIITALIYFFFLLGMQPIENTLVARFTPQKLRHSAYGFKFILTFGVGSLAVKMVGLVEHQWGISQVFPLLGVISCVLVSVVVVLMIKTRASA